MDSQPVRKIESGHQDQAEDERASQASDGADVGHKSSDKLSHHSRQSINVRLPSTSSDRHEAQSPDRLSDHFIQNLGHMTPDRYSANSERQPRPTPASRQSGKTLSPSPTRSLRHGLRNQRELIRQVAASVIERTWIGYRDKRMFNLLKHSVCAAEHSMSIAILRKVNPREAKFFEDKTSQIKIRFRFGGVEFPPMIYFKVYSNTEGKGLKYISGKKMIKPASEAAEDSLRLMGNRLFYDQMLQDAIFHKRYNISDEVDITTLKDYMQYLAYLDETPAYLGGRENYWRKLTLDDLSRHTIFYDIVDYAYHNVLTPRLKEEIPLMVSRPITQEIQLQQIQSISATRTPSAPAPSPNKYKDSTSLGYTTNISNNSDLTSRRSRKARLRALKMRKMYSQDKEHEEEPSGKPTDYMEEKDELITTEPHDDLEQEGSRLYEWTQELSFNDDIIATPRLVMSTS